MTNAELEAIRARCEMAFLKQNKYYPFPAYQIRSMLDHIDDRDKRIETLTALCKTANLISAEILNRVSHTTGRMSVSQDLYFSIKYLYNKTLPAPTADKTEV